MPLYCYTTDDGETVERYFPMGGAPASVKVGDKVACRDRAAEAPLCFVKGSQTPVKQGHGKWPMTCFASGVHPSQAQELRDHLKRNGVPTDVNKDGDPIYTSKEHRKKALKARGMHDKSSFD